MEISCFTRRRKPWLHMLLHSNFNETSQKLYVASGSLSCLRTGTNKSHISTLALQPLWAAPYQHRFTHLCLPNCSSPAAGTMQKKNPLNPQVILPTGALRTLKCLSGMFYATGMLNFIPVNQGALCWSYLAGLSCLLGQGLVCIATSPAQRATSFPLPPPEGSLSPREAKLERSKSR